ncbi:MAG: hypothetical protein HUU54_05450 [Ignavibacteriaceae bacterium]|nr:hypothetical protein [Ignavibacteriaceae bacterium]
MSDNNIVKEYLLQCVNQASSHLKLTAEKIEMIGILREEISGCSNLDCYIKEMKKVTELAKLALKFTEIVSFVNNNKIEYATISEKFRQHSYNLVKELSVTLDVKTSLVFRSYINRVRESYGHNCIPQTEPGSAGVDEFSEEKKENLLLHEESEPEQITFYKFEEMVTKPISSLDNALKNLLQNEIKPDELKYFANLMKRNWTVSKNFDSQIISNMHEIVGKTLFLFSENILQPNRQVVDALRACLIVIVALIKDKEIDISVYLRKAEELGNSIKTIKVKDF